MFMVESRAHVWTNEMNLLKNRIEITKLKFLLLSSLEIQNILFLLHFFYVMISTSKPILHCHVLERCTIVFS